MADIRITHVRKKDRMNSHEHITHVGNLLQQLTWIASREDVIALINRKEHTFYVQENGRRSEVGVVNPSSEAPYLRTHADGYWNDNLLSLPEC